MHIRIHGQSMPSRPLVEHSMLLCLAFTLNCLAMLLGQTGPRLSCRSLMTFPNPLSLCIPLSIAPRGNLFLTLPKVRCLFSVSHQNCLPFNCRYQEISEGSSGMYSFIWKSIDSTGKASAYISGDSYQCPREWVIKIYQCWAIPQQRISPKKEGGCLSML